MSVSGDTTSEHGPLATGAVILDLDVSEIQMAQLSDPGGALPEIKDKLHRKVRPCLNSLIEKAISHEQCRGQVRVRIEVQRMAKPEQVIS